jgi:hypothetical protein
MCTSMDNPDISLYIYISLFLAERIYFTQAHPDWLTGRKKIDVTARHLNARERMDKSNVVAHSLIHRINECIYPRAALHALGDQLV